jgi:hypothetical protein
MRVVFLGVANVTDLGGFTILRGHVTEFTNFQVIDSLRTPATIG